MSFAHCPACPKPSRSNDCQHSWATGSCTSRDCMYDVVPQLNLCLFFYQPAGVTAQGSIPHVAGGTPTPAGKDGLLVLAPFVGTGKPRCFVTNKCKSFWKGRNKQLVHFKFNYPTATRPRLVWCCWDGRERTQRTRGARAPKEQQRAQGSTKRQHQADCFVHANRRNKDPPLTRMLQRLAGNGETDQRESQRPGGNGEAGQWTGTAG